MHEKERAAERNEAQTIVLTGTMDEVCAKLQKEARGCKGMNFAEWLKLRMHEKRVEKWIERGFVG